jgi:prophage regulatory protein
VAPRPVKLPMNNVSSPYRMLRLRQVKEMIALSKTAIYYRIAQGTFPKPVNLGGKSVGWLESEVNTWIESRITASRD